MRTRTRGFSSRVIASIIMAVAGVTILVASIPSWVFFCAFGAALVMGAWMLVKSP
ncbi:MAG: hypothetical protein ACOX3V_07725 [Bacillota bacterium]